MRAPFLANSLWGLASLPAATQFARAMGNVEQAQTAALMAVLRHNADTDYGRRYHFADITSVGEYQTRVPLVRYDDLQSDIQRMAQGESDVLFPGRPQSFIPTSGSTAATKLIPYTPALRSEFQRGIAPWIAGMFRTAPQLRGGRAYWSISPVTQHVRHTPGGTPIGYDDDADYLHPVIARLLAQVMAVPSSIARIPEMEVFRYITLTCLLRARDLRFISVWNPTFLTLLFSPLSEWGESLVRDLAQGTLQYAEAIPADIRAPLLAHCSPAPRRAREVEAALTADPSLRFTNLWPQLSVISCWTAAAAATPARQLQHLFPGVQLAPKGLLATEGMVSIPLGDRHGHALAIRSHFFEFLPLDGGEVRTAWQLEYGHRYQVVLTTGGGLYRYLLGDLVRVDGFVETCPTLEFLGRQGSVSDLRGEKLHEAHVAQSIHAAADRLGFSVGFALLTPEVGERSTGYRLYVTGETAGDEHRRKRFAQEVERGLCENIHYDYCRRLGQLAPMRCQPLTMSTTQAYAVFTAVMSSRGMRAGDIKPVYLDTGGEWAERLY